MIHEARLPRGQLAKYILAYLCFYDTGTSSWIADQPDFWKAMAEAADTAEHPRGGDRRHFRGDAARRSVANMRSRGATAEELLDYLADDREPTTLSATMGRVRELRGFGETIAFKAADMLERLWGADMEFKERDPLLISKAPLAGAEAMAKEAGKTPPSVAIWAHEELIKNLGGYPAPPRYERTLTVLETETILCKWKHHLNGSYYVGKGKESQRKGLGPYLERSATARRMDAAGRRAGLWIK